MLNIVLEISGKIIYIAFHVHIILVILQCYLPWPHVICLGKCYLLHTATNHILPLPANYLSCSWEVAGLAEPTYIYICISEHENNFSHFAGLFRSSKTQKVLVSGQLCYCKLQSMPLSYSKFQFTPSTSKCIACLYLLILLLSIQLHTCNIPYLPLSGCLLLKYKIINSSKKLSVP